MQCCNTCQHVHRQDSRNPNAWLCARFPRMTTDARTGEEDPPYHYCRDVLRLRPNDTLPCVLWEALPEIGEPVVKEGIKGKSVTFKQKEEVE